MEQKVILNEEARKISSCRVGLGRLLWRPAVCLPSLRESVLYSIHAGGKRIRPFLLLEVLEPCRWLLNQHMRRWLRLWR